MISQRCWSRPVAIAACCQALGTACGCCTWPSEHACSSICTCCTGGVTQVHHCTEVDLCSQAAQQGEHLQLRVREGSQFGKSARQVIHSQPALLAGIRNCQQPHRASRQGCMETQACHSSRRLVFGGQRQYLHPCRQTHTVWPQIPTKMVPDGAPYDAQPPATTLKQWCTAAAVRRGGRTPLPPSNRSSALPLA